VSSWRPIPMPIQYALSGNQFLLFSEQCFRGVVCYSRIHSCALAETGGELPPVISGEL
jgi:hypothetical protein